MQCAETITTASPHEARLVLEPYFEELRERFLQAGWDRLSKTRLRCRLEQHDTPRHFAGCLEDGLQVYVAPQLIELSVETVLGILAHELGHAADFLYPGEFLLRGDHVVHQAPDKERLRGWRRRDDDTVEVVADLIAEQVIGAPIGYRGPCQLQMLGLSGRPRPVGLR